MLLYGKLLLTIVNMIVRIRKMLSVTACGILRNALVLFLLASPCWVVLAGCSQPMEIEPEAWESYGIETEGKHYKPQYSSDYNYDAQDSSDYNYNSQYSSSYKPKYSSDYNYNSQYSSSYKPQDSSSYKPQDSSDYNYNAQYSSSYKPQGSSYYNYNSQYSSGHKPQDSSYYNYNSQYSSSYNYKSQQDQEKQIKFTPYYNTLGLPYGASLREITKAYKRLAPKCHPDKNPNDATAKEKFQKLNEAHSQLRDAYADGHLKDTE
jgi:DnaJ domain